MQEIYGSGEKANSLEKSTYLTSFISDFRGLLNRLSELNQQMEKLGHKLQDTNYPTETQEKSIDPPKPPSGLITDLKELDNRLMTELDRYAKTFQKLSELI